MPDLSTREAVEKLIRAVESMKSYGLLDFYNEIFPTEPKSKLNPADAGAGDRRKVIDYIIMGLEIEEIVDLWNVAFPETCNVYYDDETATIHFSEEPEASRLSE